ncbi:LysR family transcriptional regulator [Thalassotalea ganghwensis]
MPELNWDDLKIAHKVAKLGSVSKAAEQLNINYTTVLRRIGQLEQALATKLFIRHQRGIKLSDSGYQFLSSMPDIEFKVKSLQTQLSLQNHKVAGRLKITTLSEYSSFLHPVLKQSQRLYPELTVQVDVNDEIVPLESGEAHISIRAGQECKMQGDLIAKKICDLVYSYYAAPCYISAKGLPQSPEEFKQHQWVMPSGKKRSLSFVKDVLSRLTKENISYQSNELVDIQSAIEHGMGIGPIDEKKINPSSSLVKVSSINVENENSLWFVYHKDVKEDAKIKAMLKLLYQRKNDVEQARINRR